MQEDFFAELGETLSRTAKDISSRADSFFESQKIRTKIMSEQRMIDKAMEDIGNIVYRKYVEGGAVGEDVAELCADITRRKVTIAKYRETASQMKGQQTCAACGADIPAGASFCMMCGAPVEKAEETAQEETSAEDTAEEAPEEGEPAEDTAAEEEPAGETDSEE